MIKTSVTGDREVVLGLQRVEEAARGEIRAGIGRIALKLMVRVKAQKLSGQALNVRSNLLRSSVNYRIDDSGPDISGIVGTNVEYAAIHEFGFKGQMSVKQHLRQLRTASKFSLRKVKGQSIGVYMKTRGKLTGGVATVKAHTRNVDLPERSFLRSALKELKASGVIELEIDKSIARALRKAK